MQFLKTLFWVIVAVVAVLFFYTNWQPVTLKLWGGLEADVKLPVLFLAFLLGFLPTFIVYRARIWSLKRRLEPATAHVVSPPAPARAGRRRRRRARAARATDSQGLAGRMTSPIFVAIDTPDLDRAKSHCRRGSGTMSAGSSSASNSSRANGPDGVREMAALGLPIFLDLKLHDIPNTVAKAVQALHPLEPAILTVHAAGGRAMMEDAKAAAPSGTKVVGGHRADQPRRGRSRRDRHRRRCRTRR